MANSKFKFLKKNALKNAGPVLAKAGIRTASAVATMYGATKLRTPNAEGKTFIPEKAHKYVGPGLVGLGLLGEVFLDNEYMRAAAEGITVAGGICMTGDLFLKEKKSQIGLAGIGAPAPANADVAAAAWDRVMAEARRISNNEEAPNAANEENAQENIQGAEEQREVAMAGTPNDLATALV